MASPRSDGLGFLDRLVILVAWLASCGVVFVIGYYVGKDAVPSSAAIVSSGIQVPVDGVPPGAEETTGAGTFYERLGRQTGGPAGPASVGPSTTTPTREIVDERRTTTTVRTTTTEPVRPPPTRPHPVESTVPTIPPTTSTIVSRPAVPAAPGRIPAGHAWAVYVSPTRDRFEAERQRSALRTLGYDARVVQMQRDGDVWYRVRAGRFESEASAERARRDLRERGIGRAFVQSE